MSQTELAALLLQDKVVVTRLVAELIRKGLADQRTGKQDRRKRRIYLTAKAKRLMPKLLAARDEVAAIAYADLTERDRAALTRINRKLRLGCRTWIEQGAQRTA